MRDRTTTSTTVTTTTTVPLAPVWIDGTLTVAPAAIDDHRIPTLDSWLVNLSYLPASRVPAAMQALTKGGCWGPDMARWTYGLAHFTCRKEVHRISEDPHALEQALLSFPDRDTTATLMRLSAVPSHAIATMGFVDAIAALAAAKPVMCQEPSAQTCARFCNAQLAAVMLQARHIIGELEPSTAIQWRRRIAEKIIQLHRNTPRAAGFLRAAAVVDSVEDDEIPHGVSPMDWLQRWAMDY
jgi:hypothetical protein